MVSITHENQNPCPRKCNLAKPNAIIAEEKTAPIVAMIAIRKELEKKDTKRIATESFPTIDIIFKVNCIWN